MLIQMGSCPFCDKGHSTPCFATYSDGYHCYSCGKNKHSNKNEYAFMPMPDLAPIELPTMTTNISKFSPLVMHWLYKYYVFEDLIKKYNIGYVPSNKNTEESLVFGSYIDNVLEFWQQRFFPSKKFRTGGNKNTFFFIPHKENNTIVLVEDFISAIRVGEHANVLCLWGTNLNNNMLKFLLGLDMNILIWLDPDEAGQIASNKVFNKLLKYIEYDVTYRAFAIRESRILKKVETAKQPKEYSSREIRLLLPLWGKYEI